MEKPPVLKNPKLREAINTRVVFPSKLPAISHYAYYRMSDTEYLVPASIKIQNRDLSYSATGDGLLTATVDIYLRVTGLDGKIYYEFDDTIYSRYSNAEFPKHEGHYSVYQRLLRLPPGRFKFDLLVQSETGQKSGLFTSSVLLPSMSSAAPAMRLSPVTLSCFMTRVIGTSSQTKQFVIGGMKVVPAFENAFATTEKIGVYLQGYNLQVDPAKQAPAATVLFQIWTQGGKLLREVRDESGWCIQPASDRVVIARHIGLDGLAKGKYHLTVLVEDRIAGKELAQTADFEITG